MALTKKDLQSIKELIKETMQPQFDEVKNDIKKLELNVNSGIRSLQIYMDARFAAIDRRFEAIDRKFETRFVAMDKKFDQLPVQIIAEMDGLYTSKEEYRGLEKRVTDIESTVHKKIC